MPAYAALLRAVNVGGTGKLPMSELQAMCEAEGYAGVRTYIASGNVVFHTPLGEAQVKAALERRLQAYAGKPVRVLVRTAAELARIIAANPFPDEQPNRTVAILLDHAPRPTHWPRRPGNRTNGWPWASARSTWHTAVAWPIRSCGSRPATLEPGAT